MTKQTASKATQKGTTMANSAAASSLSRMAKSCGPFIRIAGLSGATCVGLGAYGAHCRQFKINLVLNLFHSQTVLYTISALMLNKEVSDERKRAFTTANNYHFIHTLALLSVPLARRPALVRNSREFIIYFTASFL